VKTPKPKSNVPNEDEKQKAYEDFKKTAEYQRLNFGRLD